LPENQDFWSMITKKVTAKNHIIKNTIDALQFFLLAKGAGPKYVVQETYGYQMLKNEGI